MVDILLIRLLPKSKVDSGTFRKYLDGIEIAAFDKTVRDVSTPTSTIPLGTSSGLATPFTTLTVTPATTSKPIPSLDFGILQHFNVGAFPPAIESVATAVIIVAVGSSQAPEYPPGSKYDIVLQITRNGATINDDTIEYNVIPTTVTALSEVQTDYMGMAVNPIIDPEFIAATTSAYVSIPPNPVNFDPSAPSITLNKNGQAPEFNLLLADINAVLKSDDPVNHPTVVTLAPIPLSVAQALTVASDIIYNRALNPPPAPPAGQAIENLYGPSGNDDARSKFEASLTAYHAQNDADALRLSGYVFALTAAIYAERLSTLASTATFTFPIDSSIQNSSGTNPTASVTLSSGGSSPLVPPFVVPAAFFYALTVSLPPQNSPDQRYRATVIKAADTNNADLKSAVDMGVLSSDSQALTLSPGGATTPAITIPQAVRRLAALAGSTPSKTLPTIKLAGDIQTIVTAWLGVTHKTDAFWNSEYAKPEYLNLILEVISSGDNDLKTAILAMLPGTSKKAHDLPFITDGAWKALFQSRPVLLPSFTLPGNTNQRALAYIAYIRKLFTVGFAAAPNTSPTTSDDVPMLSSGDSSDVLQQFLSAYPGGFDLSATLNETQIDATLSTVFAQDTKTQKWVKFAIETISVLFKLTNLSGLDHTLQFSYMEALYARGFVTAESVAILAQTQFRTALSGTVAYGRSTDIWALASSLASTLPNTGPEQGFVFSPVNPGNLVDCIAPPNLSPLGPIQYLHEALQVSSAGSKLSDVIAARRGPLGSLLASKANLETVLPLIDLVNESLESLGSNLSLPSGAIYNTTDTSLVGLKLGSGPSQYDPDTLLAVIPQYSSPAVPVGNPTVYDTLQNTFTSPHLPYSEPLDVSRSNLCHIGTTRFETTRTFRQNITELALKAELEPSDFQRNLYRYPVRFEIALEYLKISAEEYAELFSGKLTAAQIVQQNWFEEIESATSSERSGGLPVTSILTVTGLTYCEFIELWKCGLVKFHRAGDDSDFPVCGPCCIGKLSISFGDVDNAVTLLSDLIIFVRLWRKLQLRCKDRISWAVLTDICSVLGLVSCGNINPDFIRQLAALLMLHDHFCLPWSDCPVTCDRNGKSQQIGEKRTKLLALWVGPEKAPEEWEWALHALLDGIEHFSKERHHGCPRDPEYRKIIVANLDKLSCLAGYTQAYSWNFSPTCTIRFAEVLAKINASKFSVGELIFLFTPREHLDGDDPFPWTERFESRDDPLNVPEDDVHGLWELRHMLLHAEVCGEDINAWSWPRIESFIRGMGFGDGPSTSGSLDALTCLGEHFFPETLEHVGQGSSRTARQYTAALPLSSTSPHMWRSEPCELFHYKQDAGSDGTGYLWLQLPVENEKVLHKLREVRQLNPAEMQAVQDLYFAPRATLAPFALIFSNFGHAVDYLVQEPCEQERFCYFQRQFALFHRRCEIIAEHLAFHVGLVLGCDDKKEKPEVTVAWRILNSLVADENFAREPWENNSGTPPSNFTWYPWFSANAFAAILGLIGTGLCGEYNAKGSDVWHEMRGGIDVFGRVCNEWNTPVPTVLPSLSIQPVKQEQDIVSFKNGLALHNTDNHHLGGAEAFRVFWSGVLLIDKAGHYCFSAGHPTPDGVEPSFECPSEQQWLVTLRRGQNTWTLLKNGCEGESAPSNTSFPLRLHRGAYYITIRFYQLAPRFHHLHDVKRTETGFQLKYNGPDTKECPITLPFSSLFRQEKPISARKTEENIVNQTADQYLKLQYVSSLRDIRRTYQRAFKAVLYAHRFCLHAHEKHCDKQSELGFMLDHPDRFLGTSYYQPTKGAIFKTHHAYFDFNLLPVSDSYFSPSPANDSRVNPSIQRQAALFDLWERTFDYIQVRSELERLHKRPLWLLFQRVAEDNPIDPAELVRYLHVDTHLAKLVLTYFATPLYKVVATDLLDERWAIRVWHAGKWILEVQKRFFSEQLDEAQPALWAGDDPNALIGTATGNQNLIQFVQRSSLASNGTPRRFQDIKKLNDGLRQRARAALFDFLCGMNRVPLTTIGNTGYATTPRDLSDLLLQDVDVGLHERSSRIEDAIHAVQTFVQRARIGLEPNFQVTYEFSKTWECRFASFETWATFKRRKLYHENWIQWEAIRKEEKTESFRLLQKQLQSLSSTIVVPGRPLWLSGPSIPSEPSLESAQTREGLTIGLQQNSLPEGLPLIGTPRLDATPTLIAPNPTPFLARDRTPHSSPTSQETLEVTSQPKSSPAHISQVINKSVSMSSSGIETLKSVPLWVRAAVRLGTRFIRVAASSIPPAVPYVASQKKSHCCQCGETHAPFIDEYYFWLQETKRFDIGDAVQVADLGVKPTDPSSAWEEPPALPKLLHWPSEPMVHLFWSRVRCGVLEPPRRSDRGVHATGSVPDLEFIGRNADSLVFTALQGSTTAGFRYDIATDRAVITPQVIPDNFPTPTVSPPTPLKNYPLFIYFDAGAPLFPVWPFATALVIAGKLRSNCQFEEALKWCRAIYDPLQRTNTWAVCPAPQSDRGETANESNHIDAIQLPSNSNGPCCPSSPVKDGFGRGRAVLLQYLGVLLQWGDQLMSKNSIEAFQQALTIFNIVERILGPTPVKVCLQDETTTKMTVASFVAAPAPLNPNLLNLYDQVLGLGLGLGSDRRGLVHGSLNSRRLPTGIGKGEPAPWGLHRRWDTGNVEQPCQTDCTVPTCKPYRFTSVFPKALEWAIVVKGLGASLLAAFEKSDSSTLEALRATHDRQLLDLGLGINKDQWRAADWDVQALDKQMESTLVKLRYYQGLIDGDLNAGETGYKDSTQVSMESRTGGNVSEATSQAMSMIPDIWFGVAGEGPLEANQMPLGVKLGTAFSAVARIMNTVADIAGSNASLNATQGGWDRRLAEWHNQVDLINIEIQQIKRQQLAAWRRRDAALQELNNHQRQMEHAAEVQDFLRDRFSKFELYLFLQDETTALYRRAYDTAIKIAREAQLAFRYERGDGVCKFMMENLWDGLHNGLMAGEKLELNLREMERIYLNSNCREYELSKSFSLRLHFPKAFLNLKSQGWCELDIPEWIFDLDYPGHYMRRIKNVRLTIPCVAGPYTGVHCRLSLLSSLIRERPLIPGPEACCCPSKLRSNNLCEHDPYVVRRYAGTEAIATSLGQEDTGLFELNFRDERYLPFEFAGAVSRWRIELPPDNNQFDMDTLSDFVLHLSYTSREGGQELRSQASQSSQLYLPGGGIRFFDIHHEFSDLWRTVINANVELLHHRHRDFPLHFRRSMFPFLTGRRRVCIVRLYIFVKVADACPGKSLPLEFFPKGVKEDCCHDDKREIILVSCADLSSVYQGFVDLHINVSDWRGGAPKESACLRFPRELGCVEQAFILCEYEAVSDFDPCEKCCC